MFGKIDPRCVMALLVGCGLLVFTGCTSIPERDLGNAFKYQRLKRARIVVSKPIPSEFQELAAKAWDIRASGGTAEYVSILELGDDALLARIHLIRCAQHSIDLQTFIWKDDATSRFIFDELVKAAERGVLVRVLIDALNQPAEPAVLARMARAHRNLEIALFKPLNENVEIGAISFWDNVLFKAKKMNRRMHNKLLLIDGRIGIAGGRNYDDRYFDRDTTFLFRDRDVVVAGPSVQQMQDSFDLFWQDKRSVFLTQFADIQREFSKQTGGWKPLLRKDQQWMFAAVMTQANQRSISRLRPTIRIHEADKVSFACDSPRKFKGGVESMDFEDWFKTYFADAQDRLVLQTPYLIYSRNARIGFKEIRKKHPEFRIIASSNSLASADHAKVYALSFKHRKELYKKTGIDIYEAKPYPEDQTAYVYGLDQLVDRAIRQSGIERREDIDQISRAGPTLCIHAKSFVLDGKIALIGSHNFDPRSAELNTECGVFIEDKDVAQELEARILNACEPQNSWTVSKGPHTPVISYFSGAIGAVSTALPVFDIWPYRYTTNYELNEGADPLPPRSPGFQKNYTDIGYFPEVPDSVTVIQTRLMKAFGGWARSFM